MQRQFWISSNQRRSKAATDSLGTSLWLIKWCHTNEFQLLVETGLLEWTTRRDISLATNPAPGNGHGGLGVPADKMLTLKTKYDSQTYCKIFS